MSMITDYLNKSFPLKNAGYSNALSNFELPRHRWYFIKEAFSPYIVEKAIEDTKCNNNDIIIDPFCGSGTVPLTASLNSYNAIGFEVNPFLSFLSRVKHLQVDPKVLSNNISTVIKFAKKGKKSNLEAFSTFSESSDSEKWLFNKDVIRSFEGGWSATEDIDPSTRDLLRLGLLGAAMDTCNASRDGKCLRYKKNWQGLQYGRSDFINAFQTRMEKILKDIIESPIQLNLSKITLGDCRQELKKGITKKFKLCITSPPYLNSFDYSDIYRPELFLGKFVNSNKELRIIRKNTIRSHVQVNWKPPIEDDFGSLYKSSIEHIISRLDSLWDKKIPLMIQAYFEDMKNILSTLRSLAEETASLWLIVSTSAYTGIEIPVDLIIAEIGTKVGWYLREVGVLRHLRSSSQHWEKTQETEFEKIKLRESVVIFDASFKHKR